MDGYYFLVQLLLFYGNKDHFYNSLLFYCAILVSENLSNFMNFKKLPIKLCLHAISTFLSMPYQWMNLAIWQESPPVWPQEAYHPRCILSMAFAVPYLFLPSTWKRTWEQRLGVKLHWKCSTILKDALINTDFPRTTSTDRNPRISRASLVNWTNFNVNLTL